MLILFPSRTALLLVCRRYIVTSPMTDEINGAPYMVLASRSVDLQKMCATEKARRL